MTVLVLAEIGVNHNGSVELAKQLIDAAKDAGADAVKFQTFAAEDLVTRSASKAKYQMTNDPKAESQFDMLKRLEFSDEQWREVIEHCRAREIEFVSTPFSLAAVDQLQQLGVQRYKVSSGDLTFHDLLQKIAATELPVIISTGMATMDEIGAAVRALEAEGNRQISILHCVSNYPASNSDCNLRAIPTISEAFGYPVGWSDHSFGDHTAIASIALGATIIEKHITLDKDMEGPDHRASMQVPEFVEFVAKIRNVEAALGDGVKIPTAAEKETAIVARRSLTVLRAAKAGEVLTRDDVVALRPGYGISPADIDSILGCPLACDVDEYTTLEWSHFQTAK